MKHILLRRVVFLLMGTVLSLQAIPMLEEHGNGNGNEINNNEHLAQLARNRDQDLLEDHQIRQQVLTQYIYENPAEAQALVPLQETLNQAVQSQQELINRKNDHANALQGNDQTQITNALQNYREAAIHAKIKTLESNTLVGNLQVANKLYDWYNKLALDRVNEEQQQTEPQQLSNNLYQQAANFYKQAANATESVHPFEQYNAHYLAKAGTALYRAAREAQQVQPRQKVIDLYQQAANLYQQAAPLDLEYGNNGNGKRKLYLEKQGDALCEQAAEAAEQQPQQNVINLYQQVADLYTRASTIANFPLAERLSGAGTQLSCAARIAQRGGGNQIEPGLTNLYNDVINLHNQVMQLTEKVTVLNQQIGVDQIEQQNLNKVISVLSKAIHEVQQAQPRQNVIEFYNQSATLRQSGMQARAAHNNSNEFNFNNASTAFYEAAEESLRDRQNQNLQPRQNVIDAYTLAAQLHRDAQQARVQGNQTQAHLLTNQANQAFKNAKNLQYQ